MRNTQREKRAEARAFLNRYNGFSENVLTPDMLNPIDKNPTGEISDDTQDEKKNAKFNWKNPSDSDLIKINIALSLLLIIINIFKK